MAYELTKKFEGCSFKAYPDPGSGDKPWTIAYGHTLGVCKGDTCTQDEADFWLMSDMSVAIAAISDLVKVPVNANQREALADFIFNVGRGNFASSTLLKLLNQKLYDQCGAQFLRWDKASGKVMQGLINRRIAEQELFDKPVAVA